MTRELLEKILKSSEYIKFNGWIKADKYGYSRNVSFSVRGVDYGIEWWCNICYLIIGELQIPFERVEVSGTWPNNFKDNLQFYYKGNVCAILPIEEYPKN